MKPSAEQLTTLRLMLLGNIHESFSDLPEELDLASPASCPALRLWARSFTRHLADHGQYNIITYVLAMLCHI
jgi:hypothetical protein